MQAQFARYYPPPAYAESGSQDDVGPSQPKSQSQSKTQFQSQSQSQSQSNTQPFPQPIGACPSSTSTLSLGTAPYSPPIHAPPFAHAEDKHDHAFHPIAPAPALYPPMDGYIAPYPAAYASPYASAYNAPYQGFAYTANPATPNYQALPWVLEAIQSDKLTVHGDRLTVSLDSRGSGYALGTLPLASGRWSWSVKINSVHKSAEVVAGVVQKIPALPSDYMASYSAYAWSSTGYVFSSAGPSDACAKAKCEAGDVLLFVLDLSHATLTMTNARTGAILVLSLDKGSVEERGPFFPYLHLATFTDPVSVSVFSS
eukprot:TRINITY_DN826_c0_g2_i2.p1 TRINITY_DN826_c0_g2~~TRINITY_DN826_c0_g2_i2.p1  ORF type:complete len:313 (-),score=54.01 TRINITY_DN826_c0_g2_i2:264-1202(-)